jgi:hypothetical protein
MKRFSRFAIPLALATSVAASLVAFAQNSISGSTGVNLTIVKGYSASILYVINNVFVPVVFALAFLTFLWGVYKYFILGATEEKSRVDGRNFVFWGIIGFVVILSIWGLVAVVGSTFGLTAGGTAPNYPML